MSLVPGHNLTYFQNIMFDNTPQPSPSTWSSLKSHLPLVILVLGVGGIAIGLHTAVTAVAVLAVVHVVGAGLLFGIAYLRRPARAER